MDKSATEMRQVFTQIGEAWTQGQAKRCEIAVFGAVVWPTENIALFGAALWILRSGPFRHHAGEMNPGQRSVACFSRFK